MGYLVIGAGESNVDAIRAADSDPENWEVAKVLFPKTFAEVTGQDGLRGADDRWCVLVEDPAVADDEAKPLEGALEFDRATLRWADVGDSFAFILAEVRRNPSVTRDDLETLGAL